MRVLVDQYREATHVGQRLLDFVEAKSQETMELRLCALKAAGNLKPTRTLGQRLLGLLGSTELDIVTECLRILSAYAGVLPADEAVHLLEILLGPSVGLAVRCRAIELLGKLGEIDSLERVMLLPLTHAQEHAAVQSMVHHLMHKPRSVVRLAPKNFEHLICRLLQKMKYDDVGVERKASWDDGVDVTAWYQEDRMKGRERLKMLGQCKRYQKTNLVGPDTIDRMVEALQSKEAGRGVIITTSGFHPAATQRARMHRSIEIIDGTQLQVLLDQHFSASLYRVAD